MRQRVHAGCRGEARGQAERQVRIAERDHGDQVRRRKGFLAAILHDDDHADRDFRAGAGGGRYRDQGRDLADLLGAADDRRVGFQRFAVGGQEADRLGMVHGGAAADRDDAVRAGLLVELGRNLRLGLGRVGDRFGEHAGRGNAERILDLRQDAGGLDARVRHDEGPGDPLALGQRRELFQRARIKHALGEKIHDGHQVHSSREQGKGAMFPTGGRKFKPFLRGRRLPLEHTRSVRWPELPLRVPSAFHSIWAAADFVSIRTIT